MPTDGSATFTGPNSIANILGRVTGGERSLIDGLLRSTIPGANLYLVNPAGVIFGAHAKLDIGGSLRVSTADYLRFADGAKFQASLARDSVLTSASPVAFGFLGPTAGPISVQGSTLTVPEGQTLSLIGGDIRMSGANLSAPSGRIEIASVASAGEVVPSLPGARPDLDMSSLTALGRIHLVNTILDASDAGSIGGGTVVIRGGQLVASASIITANTGDADGATAGVDIRISGDVTLTEGTSLTTTALGLGRSGNVELAAANLLIDGSLTTVGTFSGADGAAGDVSVNATTVAVTGGASVTSINFAGGATGNVSVTATDSVSVSGSDASGLTSNISTQVLGTGNGGNVSVHAATVALTSGGTINSTNLADGATGNVSVVATDSVLVSGRAESGTTSSIATVVLGSGAGGSVAISAPTVTLDDGGTVLSLGGINGGGDITITGGALRVTGGAQILSEANGGTGGKITVSTTDSVTLSGVVTDANGNPIRSGIFSDTCSNECTGTPGDIFVDTGTLLLADGARITSGFLLSQQGGNISVTGRNSIAISGGGGIAIQASTQDIGQVAVTTPLLTLDNGFISTSTLGTARAGDVLVNAGAVRLMNGGQITSNSDVIASGDGGRISLNATNGVSISGTSSGGAPASPFASDAHSGLFSTTNNTGNAGQISVSTPMLTVDGGGKISVATAGAGNAGDVALNVGTLNLSGGGLIDSSTSGAGHGGTIHVAAGSVSASTGGGFVSNARSSGAGGDLDVRAGHISLTDGATASAMSTASGNAGNLSFASTGALHVQNSTVTTQATTADGGNITLTAGPGSTVDVVHSQITTSVQSGTGQGGNIVIDPHIVLVDHSQIRADAFGGPGGNINIVSDIFLTNNSIISASSALSTPGTITIQAEISDLSSRVVQLPAGLLQAAALLRATCAARVAAGKSSSLVVAGRDGVPPEPGGYLPSLQLAQEPAVGGPALSEDLASDGLLAGFLGDGLGLDGLPRLSQVVLDSKCAR